MWTSLRIASLGALAQQRALDVASNNLANANTVAFKRQRADIADVAPTPTDFGVGTEPGPLVLGEIEDGGGAMVVGILASFERGAATLTEQPLDFSINGDGFLTVTLGSGQAAYTRNGSLRIDANRRLTTADGPIVTPPIQVPADASAVFVTADGSIHAQRGDVAPEIIGRLQLARFPNPEGLERLGQSLYAATVSSGNPVVGAPGEAGLGSLLPGSLEASNVNVAEELIRVIQAQRAYQMNLRSLRTADEMLQAANNLQR